MSLNAKDFKQESKFKRPDPLEPGTYPGRVVWVIDKGLQVQADYKEKAKPPKHELYVVYELLDEFLKDDDGVDIPEKPRFISETFAMHSLDSDLAKSTKRYYALDPVAKHEGDWSKLIGTPCMITVVQNVSQKDKTRRYNNITGVSSMRDKDVKKATNLINTPKIFDIDDPDMEIFLSLPQWLQVNIKENLDFNGSQLEKLLKELPEEPEEDGKEVKDDGESGTKGEEEEENEDW